MQSPCHSARRALLDPLCVPCRPLWFSGTGLPHLAPFLFAVPRPARRQRSGQSKKENSASAGKRDSEQCSPPLYTAASHASVRRREQGKKTINKKTVNRKSTLLTPSPPS